MNVKVYGLRLISKNFTLYHNLEYMYPHRFHKTNPYYIFSIIFLVIQLLSCVWLFVTPWTAAHQASLSLTISQNLLKLMSNESVMSSNHLILCHPLLLLPSIFPSIKVFSKESALRIRWPKYWSFSFSMNSSNEYSGLMSWIGNRMN